MGIQSWEICQMSEIRQNGAAWEEAGVIYHSYKVFMPEANVV